MNEEQNKKAEEIYNGWRSYSLIKGFSMNHAMIEAMHEYATWFADNKQGCSCIEKEGEEIGWHQKRHCNKCDAVINPPQK